MSKFNIGDRVKLTCYGNTKDMNYGVEATIIDYKKRHGDLVPVVELCEGFDWDDHHSRRFECFEDDWWDLVEPPNECYCSSLL